MQHTQNYQLSRWAKDDRIMMEDFNADNEKIDAALKANADAVGALQTGKADAAALSEETGARTAADSTLTARVTALEQVIKIVKLAAPQVTTEVDGSIVFDLSALNMADYQAFLVFASVEAVTFTTNGQIELLCDSSSLGMIANSIGGHAAAVVWIFPAAKGVGAGFHVPTQTRSSAESVSGSAVNGSAVWDTMQNLTLRFTGKEGARAALYGLRV